MSVRIALFDFDGTLCRGGSILPYLLWCARRGEVSLPQLIKAGAGYLHYKLHPDAVIAAKEAAFAFLKGRSQDACDDLARAFWRDRLHRAAYPGALEALARMREDGWQIVLVSASASIYMDVLPELMPVDAVLATPCQFEAGCFTGKVRRNCKAEEKIRRIEEWMASQGIHRADAYLLAVGDSASDAPMLRMADEAWLAHPKRTLAAAMPEAARAPW